MGKETSGEESGRMYHRVILEEESWGRIRGAGIMKALWKRNHEERSRQSSRGIKQEQCRRRKILQEKTSSRNPGRGILERESSKSGLEQESGKGHGVRVLGEESCTGGT